MLRGYNQYTVRASVKGNKLLTPRPVPQRNFAATASKKFNVESAFGDSSMNGMATGGSYQLTGGNLVTPHLYNTLSGFLPDEDTNQPLYHKLYKDLYNYDTICGATVDLKANLPFSNFTITGVSDENRLQKYLKSVENIYITKQLPSIAVDYLAIGAYLGSLSLDEEENVFKTLMSHDIDEATFKWVPFAGMDPIIDVNLSGELKTLLNDKDPRINYVREMLPDYIVQGAKTGRVALEPGSTLYIPRRGLSSSYKGQSIFKRVLTIYLVEKAIIKGTIDQAMKRQRAILHVMAGDENWTPTDQELANLANLFRDADMDPVSAIVATRTGITTDETKGIGSLWKWDDIFEFASQAKMRALGINDAFLSGDASYNTLESALSVFLEELRAMRDYLTAEIFYGKIFAAVSIINDFKVKQNRFSVTSDLDGDNEENRSAFKYNRHGGMFKKDGKLIAVTSGNLKQQGYDVEDITEYEMPSIHWHKALKPEADKEYLELLTTLQGVGLPIPLRMWAAAGGLSIDELMSDLDDDKKLRNTIAEKTGVSVNPVEDAEIESEFSSLKEAYPKAYNGFNKLKKQYSELSTLYNWNQCGYVGLGKRDFSKFEVLKPHTYTEDGKRVDYSPTQQKIVEAKFNEEFSHALAEKAVDENYKERESYRKMKEDNNSPVIHT